MTNYRFLFEYCQIKLEDLIEERLGSNKLFPEEDLLALMKGMISILAFFQENGLTCGDCHPSAIYFDTRFGAFKVYDKEVLAGRAAAYFRAFDAKDRSVFLSPELIVAMRNEESNLSNATVWKSDVFALGMTLLEAASLQKSAECYDQNYSILAPVVQKRLEFVNNYYSAELTKYLNYMLEFEEQRRPDSLWLWEDIMSPVHALPPQTKSISPAKKIITYVEQPKIISNPETQLLQPAQYSEKPQIIVNQPATHYQIKVTQDSTPQTLGGDSYAPPEQQTVQTMQKFEQPVPPTQKIIFQQPLQQ